MRTTLFASLVLSLAVVEWLPAQQLPSASSPTTAGQPPVMYLAVPQGQTVGQQPGGAVWQNAAPPRTVTLVQNGALIPTAAIADPAAPAASSITPVPASVVSNEKTMQVIPATGESGCCAPVILNDCSDRCPNLFRFQAEGLIWWVKKGPEPAPLLTTTTQNPPDILTYGGLPDTATVLLFGQTNMNYGTQYGGRFTATLPLNDRVDLEGRGFFLLQKYFHFGVLGDSNGNPPLFEPQINMRPNISTDPNNPDFGSVVAGFPTSFPGVFGNGIFGVDSSTSLWGAEINSIIHLNTDSCWKVGVIAGFRTLCLSEAINVREGTQNITTAFEDGFFYLGSVFVNAGSRHDEEDSWKTVNNFYGGQIGLDVERQWGRFSLDLRATTALGGTVEKLSVSGATRVIPLGIDLTAPAGSGIGVNSTIIPFVPVSNFGGVMTNPAVIGNHYRSAITTVNEFNFQLGYDLSSYLRLTVGYTFLYIGNVARPGEQIDSLVNQSWLPSGVHFDNTFAGKPYPRLLFPQTDYWAQGVSLGAEFRF